MEHVIEAMDLTKVFYSGNKKIVAVDHVSFTVARGEIFGLLGPNGAGKTTTIKLLTTLLRPTEGRALVAGFDTVKEADEVRKRVAWVSSDVILDDDLKGIENMLVQARIYHMSPWEAKRRAWELLDAFGLRDAGNRYVREYSTGMRKRLEIAMALLPNPEVIFMDEPTAGLDVGTKRGLWDYVKKVAKAGVTVFLTTHSMEEAEELCGRVAIMSRGRVVAIGEPNQLKASHGEDVVVVEYLGQVPSVERVKEALSKVPNVKGVVMENGAFKILVNKVEEELHNLIQAMSRLGPVTKVSVHRSSLETVFLKLTGHSLGIDQSGSTEDYYRGLFRLRRARGWS